MSRIVVVPWSAARTARTRKAAKPRAARAMTRTIDTRTVSPLDNARSADCGALSSMDLLRAFRRRRRMPVRRGVRPQRAGGLRRPGTPRDCKGGHRLYRRQRRSVAFLTRGEPAGAVGLPGGVTVVG